VLAVLLGLENQELAQAIFEFRQQALADKDAHDFSNLRWYKELPGFGDVVIDPNLVTTASDVFRITSEAAMNSAKTLITVFVQRVQSPESRKWTCQVLNWKTE
jgi:hypothetical protein